MRNLCKAEREMDELGLDSDGRRPCRKGRRLARHHHHHLIYREEKTPPVSTNKSIFSVAFWKHTSTPSYLPSIFCAVIDGPFSMIFGDKIVVYVFGIIFQGRKIWFSEMEVEKEMY